MSAPLGIIAKRCHYCSRFRQPNEIANLPGRVDICWHCLEWHEKALQALSGQPPSGCQECGVTFAELIERADDVRMAIHQKDGIYQVLCMNCSDRYVPKRRDLYGKTEFGHRMNLH